jgi:hypothetical protein
MQEALMKKTSRYDALGMGKGLKVNNNTLFTYSNKYMVLSGSDKK